MRKKDQMVFKVKGRMGKEILRINTTGDFFIDGKLTTNAEEIVKTFKDFFKKDTQEGEMKNEKY